MPCSGFTNSVESPESYLVSYTPLSGLPTPPSSSESWRIERLDAYIVDPRHGANKAAPAVHIANQVPGNACANRPSVSVIQDFLFRARLPLETVALASCILDALSSRFGAGWRQELFSLKECRKEVRHIYLPGCRPMHRGLAKSETIVLSALSIASAYLDDWPAPTSYWSKFVSMGMYTSGEIEATNRCILKDIDYGLHLSTPDMIQEAVMEFGEAAPSDLDII